VRYLLVIVVLGSLFLGCDTSFKPEKPQDLIPESKMTDILYDLYVINATKGISKKILEEKHINVEAYILNIYQIDSVQFSNSNTYYAHNTKSYRQIVDNVKARIETEKAIYDNLKKKEDDSIRSKQKKNPKKKTLSIDTTTFKTPKTKT